MNAATFIQNFETFARSKGGIDRLRELILVAAVEGRLVEQDEAEPAVNLAGEHPSDPQTPPFTLPTGWCWTSLERLGATLGGGTPSKKNSAFWGGDIPWVSPKDMKRLYIGESIDTVTEAAVGGSAVKRIPPGSLLMVTRGMILAHSFPVALTTREVTVNQDMKAIVPHNPDLAPYLLLAMRGCKARVLALVERSTHGTCRLATSAVLRLPFGLPPLAEQKRIVAKVDELMGLCDELEKRQQQRHTLRRKAHTAALDALTNADTPEALAKAWTRLKDNWSELFSHSDAVPPLREAIRRLGVRGLLVPQVAAEGNGASLLTRVEMERKRLIDTRDAKDSRVPATVAEPPYRIPESWLWTYFDRIAQHRLGKMLDKAKNKGPLRPYLRNANVRWFGFDLTDLKEMRVPEIELEEVSLSPGDLVICEGGEPGRTAVWRDGTRPMVIQKALHRARLHAGIDPDFVSHYLRAAAADGSMARLFTGATIKHFTGRSLARLPVPLPPIAEQRRIVLRMNQLMNLCDDLEMRASEQESLAARYAQAAVEAVSTAAT